MSSYPAPRILYDKFSTETLPDKYEANGLYAQYAGYVTEAAQGAITSLGTLTELQVDNVNVNGSTIKSNILNDLNLEATTSGRRINMNSDLEVLVNKKILTNRIQPLSADLLIENPNSGNIIYLSSDETLVSSVLTVGGDIETTYNTKAFTFVAQNEVTTEGGTANLNINTNWANNSSANDKTILLNSDVTVEETKMLTFHNFSSLNFRNFNDGVSGGNNRSGLIINPTISTSNGELRFQQYNSTNGYALGSTWDYCFQHNGDDFNLKSRKINVNEKTIFKIEADQDKVTFGSSANNLSNFKVYGDLQATGTLSKGGGTFSIAHPLPAMKETHVLRHSFVEAPRMDNIYRDTIRLNDGKATINLDTHFKMTEGTFVLLNRDCSVITSNEETWEHIRGRVEANILMIECENEASTTLVSFMVIGERQDEFVKASTMTDNDGKFLPEVLK